MQTQLPWYERKNAVDDYISPEYYDAIIKDYIFDNKTDIEIFEDFLGDRKFNSILELGSGSGRATDSILKHTKFEQLGLVDLSKDMLGFLKNKYSSYSNIKYNNFDHIIFLETTKEKFDLVCSMWSFSHSVHVALYELGREKGGEEISNIISNFMENNINTKGEMYIYHFDSTSQEQFILLNQWKKAFSLYTDLTDQSPSKVILDKVLEKMTRENKVEFSCKHLIGQAINYKNEEEFLELFMNFHLETFFNKTDKFEEVKQSILNLGKQYKNADGSYSIKPGCFVYKIKKL